MDNEQWTVLCFLRSPFHRLVGEHCGTMSVGINIPVLV